MVSHIHVCYYFLKNFVAQEFRCAGVDKIYLWREKTAEVEFLREVNGKVFLVEVKSGRNTQAKSLNDFGRHLIPAVKLRCCP